MLVQMQSPFMHEWMFIHELNLQTGNLQDLHYGLCPVSASLIVGLHIMLLLSDFPTISYFFPLLCNYEQIHA